MPNIVGIPPSDLQPDLMNPRLRNPQATDQDAIYAIVNQDGRFLVNLAAHILERGLDPLEAFGVIEDKETGRYTVLDGNRRLAALRALSSPELVKSALISGDQKQLLELARKYAENPIEQVQCTVFASREEASPWIQLKHANKKDGVALIPWGADEKDRYRARSGKRGRQFQLLDFAERHGTTVTVTPHTKGGVSSTFDRLLSSPQAREFLGIEEVDGDVLTTYPPEELMKALSHIIGDMQAKRVTSRTIGSADQRRQYIDGLPPEARPDPSTKLDRPIPLDGTGDGTPPSTQDKPPIRPKQPRLPAQRKTLISTGCPLSIDHPRISDIFREGRKLRLEDTPNACAVLLRVFLELSIDHYIQNHLAEITLAGINIKSRWQEEKLGWKMKRVGDYLEVAGLIDRNLRTAIEKMADEPHTLACSTKNLNQYVHNAFIYPKASELRSAWDELQPLMEQLWP